MVFAWDGSDPVGQDDGNTGYELGVAITVNVDITVTSVRVWHPATSTTVANRAARFWTTGGVQVQAQLLDDALPSGWTTFELDAPLEITAGSNLILSYSTTRYYGAVAGGFPNDSGDGAVTYTGGLFRETFTPAAPNTSSSNFYGIDLGYTIGIGGNVAPVVTVAAAAAGRTVTATASVTDEGGALTYRWEWGDGQVTADGAASEQHTYAADGLYAVLVTVTDAGGLKDSAAAPVVAALGPSGGMSLAAVMGELAGRLDTIPKLNVYQGWPSKVVAPAAIVAYPSRVAFDESYRPGFDRYELPIVVALARIPDEKGLPDVDGYASSSGARSVKAVLESGVYATFGSTSLHVSEANFDVYPFAGVDHLVAVFDVSLMG
jgi:uncharacterized protein DUF4082/PKD domain-containing protein